MHSCSRAFYFVLFLNAQNPRLNNRVSIRIRRQRILGEIKYRANSTIYEQNEKEKKYQRKAKGLFVLSAVIISNFLLIEQHTHTKQGVL